MSWHLSGLVDLEDRLLQQLSLWWVGGRESAEYNDDLLSQAAAF